MRHVRKGIDRKSLKPADPELPPKSSVGDELAEKPWVDSFNRHGDIKDSGMEDVITGPSDDHDDPDNFMDATDQVTNAIDAADEDAQRAEGWQHDDLSVTFTEYMLKSAQDNYANAKAIMSPEDPRMRMIDSALWTWMLKVLHVIKKDPNAHVVNIILDQLAAKEEWQELRAILMKSQVQELNNAQQAMYVDLIKKCAAMFISIAASATVCTIAQLASQLLKGVLFDWIIVDEAIVMTEAQFIEIWRNSSLVILLGDQAQFGSTVLTKPFENPFVDQLRQGPFVRLIQNGWPYFMLREVMRMTSGLELICSDLFYNGKLKSGTGTELYLPSRAMSRKWQEITLSKYPSLKKEPQGLVYPIFIDIVSESEQELGGGTSWTNLFTASAIIDYVIWLVESEIAKPDEIGIATPYAAQVNLYLEQFRQLDKPNHVWELIRVGSTEWWQGKQAYCMIVDLVRASSDMADLGFMADARRLNVLHSRQTQALTIFGDKDCVKTGSTGNQEADEKESKKRNYDNRFLIQLFKWMQNRGRLVEIPAESLSQQYVKPTARAPPARAPVSAPAPGPASTSGPASTTDWDSSSNAAADAGAAWKSRENTWS